MEQTIKEKRNTAREFLKQHYIAQQRIAAYKRLCAEAREDIDNPLIRAAGLEIAAANTGWTSGGAATPVFRLLDLEQKLDTMEKEGREIAERIVAVLEKIPDTEGKAYLIEIYMLCVPAKAVMYSSKKAPKQFYSAVNESLLHVYNVMQENSGK